MKRLMLYFILLGFTAIAMLCVVAYAESITFDNAPTANPHIDGPAMSEKMTFVAEQHSSADIFTWHSRTRQQTLDAYTQIEEEKADERLFEDTTENWHTWVGGRLIIGYDEDVYVSKRMFIRDLKEHREKYHNK